MSSSSEEQQEEQEFNSTGNYSEQDFASTGGNSEHDFESVHGGNNSNHGDNNYPYNSDSAGNYDSLGEDGAEEHNLSSENELEVAENALLSASRFSQVTSNHDNYLEQELPAVAQVDTRYVNDPFSAFGDGEHNSGQSEDHSSEDQFEDEAFQSPIAAAAPRTILPEGEGLVMSTTLVPERGVDDLQQHQSSSSSDIPDGIVYGSGLMQGKAVDEEDDDEDHEVDTQLTRTVLAASGGALPPGGAVLVEGQAGFEDDGVEGSQGELAENLSLVSSSLEKINGLKTKSNTSSKTAWDREQERQRRQDMITESRAKAVVQVVAPTATRMVYHQQQTTSSRSRPGISTTSSKTESVEDVKEKLASLQERRNERTAKMNNYLQRHDIVSPTRVGGATATATSTSNRPNIAPITATTLDLNAARRQQAEKRSSPRQHKTKHVLAATYRKEILSAASNAATTSVYDTCSAPSTARNNLMKQQLLADPDRLFDEEEEDEEDDVPAYTLPMKLIARTNYEESEEEEVVDDLDNGLLLDFDLDVAQLQAQQQMMQQAGGNGPQMSTRPGGNLGGNKSLRMKGGGLFSSASTSGPQNSSPPGPALRGIMAGSGLQPAPAVGSSSSQYRGRSGAGSSSAERRRKNSPGRSAEDHSTGVLTTKFGSNRIPNIAPRAAEPCLEVVNLGTPPPTAVSCFYGGDERSSAPASARTSGSARGSASTSNNNPAQRPPSLGGSNYQIMLTRASDANHEQVDITPRKKDPTKHPEFKKLQTSISAKIKMPDVLGYNVQSILAGRDASEFFSPLPAASATAARNNATGGPLSSSGTNKDYKVLEYQKIQPTKQPQAPTFFKAPDLAQHFHAIEAAKKKEIEDQLRKQREEERRRLAEEEERRRSIAAIPLKPMLGRPVGIGANLQNVVRLNQQKWEQTEVKFGERSASAARRKQAEAHAKLHQKMPTRAMHTQHHQQSPSSPRHNFLAPPTAGQSPLKSSLPETSRDPELYASSISATADQQLPHHRAPDGLGASGVESLTTSFDRIRLPYEVEGNEEVEENMERIESVINKVAANTRRAKLPIQLPLNTLHLTPRIVDLSTLAAASSARTGSPPITARAEGEGIPPPMNSSKDKQLPFETPREMDTPRSPRAVVGSLASRVKRMSKPLTTKQYEQPTEAPEFIEELLEPSQLRLCSNPPSVGASKKSMDVPEDEKINPWYTPGEYEQNNGSKFSMNVIGAAEDQEQSQNVDPMVEVSKTIGRMQQMTSLPPRNLPKGTLREHQSRSFFDRIPKTPRDGKMQMPAPLVCPAGAQIDEERLAMAPQLSMSAMPPIRADLNFVDVENFMQNATLTADDIDLCPMPPPELVEEFQTPRPNVGPPMPMPFDGMVGTGEYVQADPEAEKREFLEKYDMCPQKVVAPIATVKLDMESFQKKSLTASLATGGRALEHCQKFFVTDASAALVEKNLTDSPRGVLASPRGVAGLFATTTSGASADRDNLRGKMKSGRSRGGGTTSNAGNLSARGGPASSVPGGGRNRPASKTLQRGTSSGAAVNINNRIATPSSKTSAKGASTTGTRAGSKLGKAALAPPSADGAEAAEQKNTQSDRVMNTIDPTTSSTTTGAIASTNKAPTEQQPQRPKALPMFNMVPNTQTVRALMTPRPAPPLTNKSGAGRQSQSGNLSSGSASGSGPERQRSASSSSSRQGAPAFGLQMVSLFPPRKSVTGANREDAVRPEMRAPTPKPPAPQLQPPPEMILQEQRAMQEPQPLPGVLIQPMSVQDLQRNTMLKPGDRNFSRNKIVVQEPFSMPQSNAAVMVESGIKAAQVVAAQQQEEQQAAQLNNNTTRTTERRQHHGHTHSTRIKEREPHGQKRRSSSRGQHYRHHSKSRHSSKTTEDPNPEDRELSIPQPAVDWRNPSIVCKTGLPTDWAASSREQFRNTMQNKVAQIADSLAPKLVSTVVFSPRLKEKEQNKTKKETSSKRGNSPTTGGVLSSDGGGGKNTSGSSSSRPGTKTTAKKRPSTSSTTTAAQKRLPASNSTTGPDLNDELAAREGAAVAPAVEMNYAASTSTPGAVQMQNKSNTEAAAVSPLLLDEAVAAEVEESLEQSRASSKNKIQAVLFTPRSRGQPPEQQRAGSHQMALLRSQSSNTQSQTSTSRDTTSSNTRTTPLKKAATVSLAGTTPDEQRSGKVVHTKAALYSRKVKATSSGDAGGRSRSSAGYSPVSRQSSTSVLPSSSRGGGTTPLVVEYSSAMTSRARTPTPPKRTRSRGGGSSTSPKAGARSRSRSGSKNSRSPPPTGRPSTAGNPQLRILRERQQDKIAGEAAAKKAAERKARIQARQSSRGPGAAAGGATATPDRFTSPALADPLHRY
ncbi:unnamed protein product [Amoebophrya sp. A120]|nr:unnamed protein product [Amoebophrya sp. A120]|eukprot:GSA120T00003801001.1